MTSYYLSTEKMTVRVDVENSRIVFAAPIVSRFVGQRFVRLLDWLARISREDILCEVLNAGH